MTKIKLCGLSRACDIEAANALAPDYVGFIFAENSRRFVTFEQAAALKSRLAPGIAAVGVFVNEKPETVARLLKEGIIDLAQLHGNETEEDIRELKSLTDKPIIQAFRIFCKEDCRQAEKSPADHILLDSGAGTGRLLDWELLRDMERPYFLAGGLDARNVYGAVLNLHPYAVDVSSGIETDGYKDQEKMEKFVRHVRMVDRRGE